MFERVWGLAVKEFIQLVRDRAMTAFIIVLPIAQLVLLAQTTSQGINELPLAVLDRDNSPASRELATALDNVPELSWRYRPASEDELSDLIDRGQVTVGVVIPSGWADALAAGTRREPVAIQVIVDASNSVAGSTAQSAVEGTINDYLRRQAERRAAQTSNGVTLHATVRYNPELNARLFAIPAQMGFIIYQVTLAVAALTFARERELGTLEQLLVTPLKRLELISGKAILAWLVGVVDFLLMYVIVTRGLDIPMRGSFLLLLALSALFVSVLIGYGVIISSFSRTQQQAMLYVFMLAMLDVALSGYLVPVKNMPAVLRYAAEVSPIQHYLTIIRSIMLKGADLATLWPQAAAMAAIGVVVAAVALATATRSLD